MKILLIVESHHQGNTLKIADAMAEVAPVTITDTVKVNELDIDDYDIVGFGSGIFYSKFDKRIINCIQNLDDKKGFAFLVSTCGNPNDSFAEIPEDLLNKKNKTVLGYFSCKALDKYILFKPIGGINKGHPDETDLDNAKKFIKEVMEKFENASIKR